MINSVLVMFYGLMSSDGAILSGFLNFVFFFPLGGSTVSPVMVLMNSGLFVPVAGVDCVR